MVAWVGGAETVDDCVVPSVVTTSVGMLLVTAVNVFVFIITWSTINKDYFIM